MNAQYTFVPAGRSLVQRMLLLILPVITAVVILTSTLVHYPQTRRYRRLTIQSAAPYGGIFVRTTTDSGDPPIRKGMPVRLYSLGPSSNPTPSNGQIVDVCHDSIIAFVNTPSFPADDQAELVVLYRNMTMLQRVISGKVK